jgi:hypothetical protein
MRRLPSGLDVAFGVFANDQTVPLLLHRMQQPDGIPFRDGIPYQPWLAAVRNTIDASDASSWDSTVYSLWLKALRSLSAPTTDPVYPQAMRTWSWAMKSLNTQLASWAQLRHDTILYVKQSYTPDLICSYPAGFVEPCPEFYHAMWLLADKAHSLKLEGLDSRVLAASSDTYSRPKAATWGEFKTNLKLFLDRFATTMTRLEAMANKELARTPFDDAETQFLRTVVEMSGTCWGYRYYDGWLPKLFYGSNEGLAPPRELGPVLDTEYQVHEGATDDRLVADVHTDQPCADCGDPGGVLHEGVGSINFLMIGVDNGPDRTIYGGAALSHYEFITQGIERLNDTTWKARLDSTTPPRPPEWTTEYLVPARKP